MKSLPLLALIASLVAAVPAYSADESTAKSAASAPMSQGCGKATKPHDHGAEKGMPTPKTAKASMGCDAAASAPAKKAKEKTHDHSKFHKGQ